MWTKCVITELLRADIKRQRSVMVIHQFWIRTLFWAGLWRSEPIMWFVSVSVIQDMSWELSCYTTLASIKITQGHTQATIVPSLRVPFMGFVLICCSRCRFRRTGCNGSVFGYTIAGKYPTVTLVQVHRCNCCLSGYYGTVAGPGFPEWRHHFCSRLIM